MYDGSRFDPNDDTAPIYGDGSLPRLPNIETERSRWDIVSWGVEPGDVGQVEIDHPMRLGAAGKLRARLVQVARQPVRRLFAERNRTLLAALAVNVEELLLEVDVAEVEVHRLAAA